MKTDPNYEDDQNDFIEQMQKEGVKPMTSIRLMANATYIQKIAIKECNEELHILDKEVRESSIERIKMMLKPHKIEATFHNDPRGYVVRLKLNHYNERQTMISDRGDYGIPTRYDY